MKEYASKQEFTAEIKKTADLFIRAFEDIAEGDKDLRLEETGRTPYESLAYQLGWMALIQDWESGELAGKDVEMPPPA